MFIHIKDSKFKACTVYSFTLSNVNFLNIVKKKKKKKIFIYLIPHKSEKIKNMHYFYSKGLPLSVKLTTGSYWIPHFNNAKIMFIHIKDSKFKAKVFSKINNRKLLDTAF